MSKVQCASKECTHFYVSRMPLTLSLMHTHRHSLLFHSLTYSPMHSLLFHSIIFNSLYNKEKQEVNSPLCIQGVYSFSCLKNAKEVRSRKGCSNAGRSIPRGHRLAPKHYSFYFFFIGKLGEYFKSACKMVPQNFII